jgi:hypothetical protein
MACELRRHARARCASSPKEKAMRTQHFLLLSSIALCNPAIAAEPKPDRNANDKPQAETIPRTDAAKRDSASDDMIHAQPAPKNRIRYTFPPATKRM